MCIYSVRSPMFWYSYCSMSDDRFAWNLKSQRNELPTSLLYLCVANRVFTLFLSCLVVGWLRESSLGNRLHWSRWSRHQANCLCKVKPRGWVADAYSRYVFAVCLYFSLLKENSHQIFLSEMSLPGIEVLNSKIVTQNIKEIGEGEAL